MILKAPQKRCGKDAACPKMLAAGIVLKEKIVWA